MDAKSSLETIKSERFKRGRVKNGRLSEILLECLTISKNSSFYKQIGRNRPIALINGCDETVHHEPLPLSPDLSIANGRPDEAWIVWVIKRVKTRPLDRDLTLWMRWIA